MFGCHNCGRKPRPDEEYEKTACANCRAEQDPAVQAYYPRDRIIFQKLQVMHPAYAEPSDDRSASSSIPAEALLTALSQTIRVLLQLKESNPETYRVIEAKMADPMLSYAQLAERLSCRKQNILYHLKKAVRICPELGCALIIDTRRLGSRIHSGIRLARENSLRRNCHR